MYMEKNKKKLTSLPVLYKRNKIAGETVNAGWYFLVCVVFKRRQPCKWMKEPYIIAPAWLNYLAIHFFRLPQNTIIVINQVLWWITSVYEPGSFCHSGMLINKLLVFLALLPRQQTMQSSALAIFQLDKDLKQWNFLFFIFNLCRCGH